MTHDRYFLDNVVEWILELDRGKYFPYEGNYSTYLEKKAKRLEQEGREEEAKQRTIKRELEWIRPSPKARQTKSKARIASLRPAGRGGRPRAGRQGADPDPAGPAARRQGHRGRGPVEGLWRQAAVRGPVLQAAAGRHRRRHRPQRRRQDDAVQDDHRPGEAGRAARSGSADSVQLGYVDQSRDHLDAKKNVWEEISDGLDIMKVGDKTR